MKSSRQKKNSLHDIPGASRRIYSQRCSYISAIIFLAEFDRKGTEKIGLEHSNNAYETIPKGKTNNRLFNQIEETVKQAKIDVLKKLKEKYGFYSCYTWHCDTKLLSEIIDELIKEIEK